MQEVSSEKRERAYEGQDEGTEVHEMLDLLLIEGISGRIGMRVSAALAHPRLVSGRVRVGSRVRRASGAAEFELKEGKRGPEHSQLSSF
jgi:hypothetical protein